MNQKSQKPYKGNIMKQAKEFFKKTFSWFDKNVEEPLDEDKLLDKFLSWLNVNKKIAFILTFFVGLITHISLITNTIMSQDGLWNSMDYYRPNLWEITLGRWGLGIIQRFNFYIAIPTVATISSLIVISIAAVFIVDLFEFKSKISVIFTSLIIAVTPALTLTLLYVYTSFAYCCNFLFSILVIWFIYKSKHKVISQIFSILLFTFVLSIYQSYIGVCIGLCIMVTIKDLISNKKTFKEILISILRAIVSVIIGGILYYGLTILLLNTNSLSLADYNNLSGFSIKEIISNLKQSISRCYYDTYRFFFLDDIIYNTNYRRDLFNGLFFILFGLASILACFSIKETSHKLKIVRGLLSIILILILPIGLNIINILAPTTQLYILTTMQLVLFTPLLFLLIELLPKSAIIKGLSILSCLVIIGSYYIADNTSYAVIKMRYNQAYSIMIRIIDRIETTPGYNKAYPICIAGVIGDNNYPAVGSLSNYSLGGIVNSPIYHVTYNGSLGTMHEFVRVFLGQDLIRCNDAHYEMIVRSDEFQELKCFPEEGCSAVIKDAMVIKINNYIPMPDGTLLYEQY